MSSLDLTKQNQSRTPKSSVSVDTSWMSVRKFVAMVATFAVATTGLTVGVVLPSSAAQAIIQTNTATIDASHNQFTLTTSPGNSGFVATGPTITDAQKANFTFNDHDAALKAGVWTVIPPEAPTQTPPSVITITGVSGISGGVSATIAAAGFAPARTAEGGVTAVVATTSVALASTKAASRPSPATTLDTKSNSFTITLTGGTFAGTQEAPGQSVVNTNFTFSANEGSLRGGQFTRTSDTVVTITGVTGLTGATSVTVEAAAMANGASSVALGQGKVDVSAVNQTLRVDSNVATITLTAPGTFAGAIGSNVAASGFAFSGPNAAAFGADGVLFTKTDTDVVTVTGLSGIVASTTTGVTVRAAVMDAGAIAVTLASPAANFTPIVAGTQTLNPVNNSFTVTLVNATFRSNVAASTITFSANQAALQGGTFSVSDDRAVLTISGVSGLSGATVATVGVAALATQAASSTATLAQTKVAVASAVATTLTAPSNSFTITLTGGTFETTGSAATTATNYTFSANQAALRAGTFSVNAAKTVVTISGVSNLTGATTVTVLPAAMENGASAVALGQGKVDVVSTANANLAAVGLNNVTITLTGGTFVGAVGSALTAADFQFVGDSLGRFAVTGVTFTKTAANIVVVSGLTGLTGTNNGVTVRAAAMENGAASVVLAAGAANFASVVSNTPTLGATSNQFTLTLGGTSRFVPNLAKTSVTFSANQDALRAGTWTVSENLLTLTISGVSGIAGATTATVLPAGLSAYQNTASVLADSIVAVTTAPFEVLVANNTVTVTLTGGTFKTTAAGLAANQFTFGGATTDNVARFAAATTFTRISDTQVTFSGISGLAAGSNTVQVAVAAMANGAASASAAGTPVPAPAPSPSGGGGGGTTGGGSTGTTTTPVTPVPAPTPTPTPTTPVTPSQPSAVQVAINLVESLSPAQVSRLGARTLATLPPAAFGVMTGNQVAALRPAQVSGFTARQIAAIKPAVIAKMKPETLAAFSDKQIRGLTARDAKALTQAQLAALSNSQRQIVERKRAK